MMQGRPTETQSSGNEGFLQNPFKQLTGRLQKPVFWLVLGIFLISTLSGYWIGSTMVFQTNGTEFKFSNNRLAQETKTYLLLETDDLSLENPHLISIWFVHLQPGEKPKLGFTPVVSTAMTESDDYELLKKFSLDKNRFPTADFLHSVVKNRFPIENYILVDQTSSAAFINWFAGKELTAPLSVEEHTMSQYGKILRGLCNSFSLPSEREMIDFPWTKIAPKHFTTSLSFTSVVEDLSYLTSPSSPRCEMIPLP